MNAYARVQWLYGASQCLMLLGGFIAILGMLTITGRGKDPQKAPRANLVARTMMWSGSGLWLVGAVFLGASQDSKHALIYFTALAIVLGIRLVLFLRRKRSTPVSDA